MKSRQRPPLNLSDPEPETAGSAIDADGMAAEGAASEAEAEPAEAPAEPAIPA